MSQESRPKRRWWNVWRRADTGQYTTEEYAEEHPETTVAERRETNADGA